MCGELPAPELFERQEQSSKIRRRFNLSGTTPISGSFEDDSPLTYSGTFLLAVYGVLQGIYSSTWFCWSSFFFFIVHDTNFCQLQTMRTGFEMLGDRGDPNSGPLIVTMYLINLLSCCMRRDSESVNAMDMGSCSPLAEQAITMIPTQPTKDLRHGQIGEQVGHSSVGI